MRRRKPSPATIIGMLALIVALGGTAIAAGNTGLSAPLKVCVASEQGKSIVTPKGGVCRAGYTLTEVGKEGAEGKQGSEGKEGPQGVKGETGMPGTDGTSVVARIRSVAAVATISTTEPKTLLGAADALTGRLVSTSHPRNSIRPQAKSKRPPPRKRVAVINTTVITPTTERRRYMYCSTVRSSAPPNSAPELHHLQRSLRFSGATPLRKKAFYRFYISKTSRSR